MILNGNPPKRASLTAALLQKNTGAVMRTLKITIMYFMLMFILTMCRGVGLSYAKSGGDIDAFEYPVKIPEPIPVIESVDCFEYAESVTGFSADALRGIAATESHFKVTAVGDGGMSLGMFQLHSRWHEARVEKWGEFDPTDPFESAVIAGRIMQENLIAFNGDLRMAIAAYRQGVRGVRENGSIQWYIDAVLNWKNDSEKMLSFLIFYGITDMGALQDGYKGARTQNTYKFNDSFAAQVSRRGSGGIPQEQWKD
jgi:hypothetical protein